MTFGDIKSGVRDAWQFTWPPVLVLTLATLIYAYVAPRYSTALVRWLIAKGTSASLITELQTLAKHYEFHKLLPVASGFTLVFILFVTSHIVNVIGLLLPPTVTHRRDLLLARTSTDEHMMKLWEANPGASTLQQLASAVYDAVATAKRPSVRRPVESWERKVANITEALSASKVLLVITVCALAAEVWYTGFHPAPFGRWLLQRWCLQSPRLFSRSCSYMGWSKNGTRELQRSICSCNTPRPCFQSGRHQ